MVKHLISTSTFLYFKKFCSFSKLAFKCCGLVVVNCIVLSQNTDFVTLIDINVYNAFYKLLQCKQM